jgi:hypothetical protein
LPAPARRGQQAIFSIIATLELSISHAPLALRLSNFQVFYELLLCRFAEYAQEPSLDYRPCISDQFRMRD